MTCPKCTGFLVLEPLLDFYRPTECWKCVNCGAYQEKRRRRHVEGLRKTGRRPPHQPSN